eukprot:7038400-Prymnesium_polylepis.1
MVPLVTLYPLADFSYFARGIQTKNGTTRAYLVGFRCLNVVWDVVAVNVTVNSTGDGLYGARRSW